VTDSAPRAPSLATVPTVEQLAARPDLATTLAPDVADHITRICLLALSAVTLRPRATSAGDPGSGRPAGDHLLTANEAAARLGISTDNLYRKARSLPFTVRVGPRQLRFSATGIERWIRRRAQEA
jgi:excisionase family DNA binding protein